MQYQESFWKDEFRCITFDFEGREAVLVFPHEDNRTGKWMLKTEYFRAFQEFELALVKQGFHLAYLRNLNRWGMDEDQDAKLRFRDFLVKEFGLESKCVPIGMSCGGLHAIKLAARHPEMVSAMYLDAPVVNLLSFPFYFGGEREPDYAVVEEMLSALSLTRLQMLYYREHPLDKIPALIAARISMLLVWGDADEVVPWDENARLLMEAYRQSDVPAMYMDMPGRGHHPHGPSDMDAAVAFIREHA